MKKHNGFTLIELLVVMSIIGILASIAIISLERGRLQARDANRKANLTTVASAMDMYKADNKVYPTTKTSSGELGGYCNVDNVGCATTADATYNDFVAKYLPATVLKPISGTTIRVRCNKTYYKAYIPSEGIPAGSSQEVAKKIAGDFYDPTVYLGNQWDITGFQVSDSQYTAEHF